MASSSTSFSLFAANLHNLITIVSVKLKATNYLIWQMQIIPLIQSLQLMNHLTKNAPESKILKESSEAIPNPKLDEWMNTDLLLRSCIIDTLSEEALGHVVGMTTAREVCQSQSRIPSSNQGTRNIAQTATSDAQERQNFIRRLFDAIQVHV
jgi:hypothetical protein